MNIIASNKRGTYEFKVCHKYVAGIALLGTEIKSIRSREVSFTGSFCYFKGDEMFVKNLYIKEYQHGGMSNHDPLRDKKLLLTKKELRKIKKHEEIPGHSVIPLLIFIDKKRLAKLEIATVKGKQQHDKREEIKQREAQISMKRLIKQKK